MKLKDLVTSETNIKIIALGIFTLIVTAAALVYFGVTWAAVLIIIGAVAIVSGLNSMVNIWMTALREWKEKFDQTKIDIEKVNQQINELTQPQVKKTKKKKEEEILD